MISGTDVARGRAVVCTAALATIIAVAHLHSTQPAGPFDVVLAGGRVMD